MAWHTIGIDISKTHPGAFRLEDPVARPFENALRGIRALNQWLGSAPVARILFEPTGPYHRAFETALSGEFPRIKVDPPQARRFAESCGAHARTDAVDARVLARMGDALKLEADTPVSENPRVLSDLEVARTAPVKERTRGHVSANPVLKRPAKARLTLVERQPPNWMSRSHALSQGMKTWRGSARSCARFPASAPSRRRRSSPSRRRSAPSAEGRPDAAPGWCPTAASPASGRASHSSAVGAPPARCARPRGHAVQTGSQGRIRRTARGRKARQGCQRNPHAQAHRNRQRSGQSRSKPDPETGLTTADTQDPAQGAARSRMWIRRI